MIQSFFQNIGSAILTTAIAVSSFFGYTPTIENPSFGSVVNLPAPVAFFETSLASRISSTDTTFTLTSATTKDGGTLATGTYAFVIDEGTALEEIVAADCAGTACSNATRGISVISGTSSVAALKKEHRRGASVKITDAPLLLRTYTLLNGGAPFPNKLSYSTTSASIITNAGDITNKAYTDQQDALDVQLAGTQTITGSKTFTAEPTVPTPTASTSAANKGYVDGIAISGAPNADTTTKGIVEEAVIAEILAGSSTGATGARLYINPVHASTTGASKLVLSKPDGTLDFSLVSPPDMVSVKTLSPDNRPFWTNFQSKYNGASATIYLQSALKSPQIRVTTSDWASAVENLSAVVLSDYTYVLLRDSSNNYRVYRYSTTNTSAGGTNMTIAGQAFASTTAGMRMSYDGTNFYFTHNGATSASSYIIAKYTLSGTTLTYSSNVTLGSTALTGFQVDLSGNYYLATASGTTKISKYNSAGSLQYTSDDMTADTGNLSFLNNSIYWNWSDGTLRRLLLP